MRVFFVLSLSYPKPKRLIIVGDLNGDDLGFATILRALKLTDNKDDWVDTDAHLVQIGDVVNRGAGAKDALDRIMRLQRQAEARGGHVSMILGNHEAMVTLQNYAWCIADEFVSFASDAERTEYEMGRSRMIYELLGEATRTSGTEPIMGLLRAWEDAHAPGKSAYRKAFAPQGTYGRFVRSLPLAIRVGDVLCTHGGLGLRFAKLGYEGIHEAARQAWAAEPMREADIEPTSILFSDDGPLWNRRFAMADDAETEEEIYAVLHALGARTMAVGHTRTEQIIGGRRGFPATRFSGRLLCCDVGIGSSGGTLAAIVVEGDDVYTWRPEGLLHLARMPEAPERETTLNLKQR